MKDYFDNEINIGDTVIYIERDSYYTAVVTGFTNRKSGQYKNEIIEYATFHSSIRDGYRQGWSLIDITALGIEEK